MAQQLTNCHELAEPHFYVTVHINIQSVGIDS